MKWMSPALPALLIVALGGASCTPANTESSPAQPRGQPLEAGPATPEESATAASMLEAARSAFADGDAATADSLATLVVERHPTTPSSTPALLLSARAAEALGDLEAAVQRADRYAALFPPGSQAAGPAQELARRARSRLEEERASRPVIGAILPRSGSAYMRRYGDLILQGVRIALGGGGEEGPIRLMVVDDSGDPGNAPERMTELEAAGAVAVIGPLLTPAVRAAAAARRDPSIPIVSPTAPDTLGSSPNTYSLAGVDPAGPVALARYAASHGLGRVAVLYPRMTQYGASAAAFEAALTAAGGRVVADVPYDSGATTFADWVGRVVKSAPQVVFVPAPERDVRQLAPQLRYYGISPDTVQVMGDENWTSDAVRHVLKASGMTGVLASTPMIRSDPRSGWQAFTRAYEQAERRTLDNPYPALGYDAALLVLQAVQEARSHGGTVAARLAALRDVKGAMGDYYVENGSIFRRPRIVRVEADRLVPVETVAEGGGPQ